MTATNPPSPLLAAEHIDFEPLFGNVSGWFPAGALLDGMAIASESVAFMPSITQVTIKIGGYDR